MRADSEETRTPMSPTQAILTDPIAIGLLALACTFGGALAGMWIRTRLPDPHLTDAAKDTVKLGVGLIATMTALVLGLVTASAKNAFDSVDSAVKHTAMDLLTFDRALARYGPETKPIRTELKELVGRKIDAIWPRDEATPQLDPSHSTASLESVVEKVRLLTPRDESQKHLQNRAVDLAETLLASRWQAVSLSAASIPVPFLLILQCWLAIIFMSFGLFAPRNLTVVVVLLLCSLSVAGAQFILLEMDRPLGGLIKVSPDPLRFAYERLNR